MNSPSVYDSIKLITCAFALVVGTLGNILVLFIVSRLKRKLTVHDVFISNLAAADLALVAIYMPLYIIIYFSELHVSPVLCHVFIPVVTTAFIASIFTITSMAIQRCRVIVNPWKRKMTRGRAIVWAVVNWVLALIITLPFMVVNRQKRESCVENWQTPDLKRAYTAGLVALQYALPLLITAGCYVRMGVYLQKSRNQLSLNGSQRVIITSRKRRENWVIFKTVAVIVVAFAVCLLPAQVEWILKDFANPEILRDPWFAHFEFAANILATFHSCLNPVIYGTVNKHFRREYAKYFSRLCACRNTGMKSCRRHERHGARKNGCSTPSGYGRQTVQSPPAFREELNIKMALLECKKPEEYQTSVSVE